MTREQLTRKIREIRGALASASLALCRLDGMGRVDDDRPVPPKRRRELFERAASECHAAGAQLLEIADEIDDPESPEV